MFHLLIILLLTLVPLNLFALAESFVEEVFAKGITVDLREPEYCEGVLRSDKGGVITGPDMRIQAERILYTRKVIDGIPVFRIEAEGNLMIEFSEYVFVGKRLEYDFQEKTGIIYDGKTSIEPWFFGGKEIILNSDGSYLIFNGFITTSESADADWQIITEKTVLYPNHDFEACNMKFQIYKRTVFWLPSIKANIKSIFDSPIRYIARWGKQGPRLGFRYEISSWNNWNNFLRFDYRLTRGPGIGIETNYRSPDRKKAYEAINYLARDSSLENPHEKFRYRFQGNYRNTLDDGKTTIKMSYDKLSDRDMATDYRDSTLSLSYPETTQLKIRRENYYWIAYSQATLRLNNFQTIKQELPTVGISFRPLEIGSTKIVSDSFVEASSLDFKYANTTKCANDYHSTRLEYSQRFYRSLDAGYVNLTPEVGGNFIHYGNVPRKNHNLLMQGIFALEANVPFSKINDRYKHTVIPYARYQYYTHPTSSPKDHYIFDIDDGWSRLNMLSFGTRQNFYIKDSQGLIHKKMALNLYANAFFNTPTIPKAIPEIYAEFVLKSSPVLKHTLSTAWNLQNQSIGHFNLRTQWTANPNFAVATEYRHRDAYDFRKADHTNFILDSYKKTKFLLKTQISDRRDTFLIHFFYRFHPKWACEFQARHGWNRKRHQCGQDHDHCNQKPCQKDQKHHHCDPKLQRNYTEFEVDFLGTLSSVWQIKLSYQHRENDRHRFMISLNLGLNRPDQWKCEHLVPKLDF